LIPSHHDGLPGVTRDLYLTIPRILIGNGFHRFHLAYLAAGLRQRDWDVELLTGAYPKGVSAAILRSFRIQSSNRLGRLYDRQVGIEPDRVHADFASELIERTGRVVASKGAVRLGEELEVASFRLAGLRAARTIRMTRGLSAYHFRSGFGLASLDAARRRGVPTICDHTSTHPAVVTSLVHNSGRLPAGWSPVEPRGIWRLAMADLEKADWIVVNSDFVRDTFEWAGVDTTRVRVIYLGVEPEFVRLIPTRVAGLGDGPLRLLFAGEIGQRKGADILFRALSTLKGVDWHLDLVGSITPALAAGWSKFLCDPRVAYRGIVRRQEVAALMSCADVFVFPSLEEGSARVIAEAMAAGCYVITTRNSGSIVEDGVHGRLVPVGEPGALTTALEEAAEQRVTLPVVGRANADLIRREYLVEHYAERVDLFYQEILGCGPSGGRLR
jgi:glycosyltransferase involved in cell wall biosynthesis